MLPENLIWPTIQFCFWFDFYLGLKGDDIVKYVTWANFFYLCSFRTVQFTYYRSLNYSFGVGHRVMECCASYAFLLL